MAEFKISKASISDAQQIHEVLEASFREVKNSYTSGAYERTVVPHKEIIERIKEGPVWIALNGNEIVGTAGGVIQGNQFYIRGMAVIPKMRKQNIGYTLLRYSEEYALENACKFLTLITNPHINKALALYKKFGFSILNKPPYDFFDMPNINMQKTL